jgi:hypothetical protein
MGRGSKGRETLRRLLEQERRGIIRTANLYTLSSSILISKNLALIYSDIVRFL